MSSYIRFDWAMKRLLRDKGNFAVLEGLITTLLGEEITIKTLLEGGYIGRRFERSFDLVRDTEQQ